MVKSGAVLFLFQEADQQLVFLQKHNLKKLHLFPHPAIFLDQLPHLCLVGIQFLFQLSDPVPKMREIRPVGSDSDCTLVTDG